MIKNLDYCCKVQTTSNNLVIKIFAHVPPRLGNYFHTSTRTSLSNAANFPIIEFHVRMKEEKKKVPIPSPLGFTKKINSKIKVISRLIALTPMQSTFRLHSAKKLYFEGSL